MKENRFAVDLVCWGHQCQIPSECQQADRCLYKSSAQEAREMKEKAETAMRAFETGATRNVDVSKLDYEGFFSPLVMKRFSEFMHENRVQADGQIRASDNWQKGIPLNSYMKSGFRHFVEWWASHRNGNVDEVAICALLFNAQGYLHEILKAKRTRTS